MIRIPPAALGVAVLGSLALGYLFRWWVGEWKPPLTVAPASAEEWTPGEYAGYPNAYHVTPLD